MQNNTTAMALLKKDKTIGSSIETHYPLHVAFFFFFLVSDGTALTACSTAPTEIKSGVHSSVGTFPPFQLGCGITMNTTWYQQNGARPHTSKLFGLLRLHGDS